MICSDEMDSCNPLTMITPCCTMGSVVQAVLANEDLSNLVAAVTAAELVETLNGEGNVSHFESKMCIFRLFKYIFSFWMKIINFHSAFSTWHFKK